MFRIYLANILLIFVHILDAKLVFAKTQNSGVPIRVEFLYKNTKLKIRLYEIKDSLRFAVARTALAKDLKKAPILRELKLPLYLKSNEPLVFALVIENKSNQPKYFFAAPHHFDPPDLSIHVFFDCLCNGHVYKILPNSIWYRVVRLEAANLKLNLESIIKNKTFKIIHDVVEISEEIANKEYKVIEYKVDESGLE